MADRLNPVQEDGPWTVAQEGRALYSDDFHHDVTLKIMGDFANDEDRTAYAKHLAAILNMAILQEKLVQARTVTLSSRERPEGGV
jgi:hypothetical protein